MQENVATVAAAPPSGDLGFLVRWANIYFSPKKTFEAVKVRPFWVVPVILLLLFGAGFGMWTFKPQSNDVLEALTKNESIMAMPAERQQELFAQIQERPKSLFSYGLGFAYQVAIIFILSGILFFLGSVVMGGEASFPKILGVFAYTAFITVPEKIVWGFLASAKGTMNVGLSLAAFFPADYASSFVYRFINAFDFFSVWFFVVLTIGLATIYNFKQRKVVAVVLPVWILGKVIAAILAGFGVRVII